MRFVFIIILTLTFSVSIAQDDLPKLKVYLDCSSGCDTNYIKRELPFVDFIRQKSSADVEVTISSKKATTGRDWIQLIFTGQDKLKSRTDTINYIPFNAADAEKRMQVTKRIRLGLIPFIIKISSAALAELSKSLMSEADKEKLIKSAEKNIFSADQKDTEKLKVFLDCSAGCDERYIRSELPFVDFVTDRLAADVHVLITSQATGGGGNQSQLIFFGQKNFKNQSDTLMFNQPSGTTDVEKRLQVSNRLRWGLIPFITKIPNAKLVEITKGVLNEVNKDTSLSSSSNLAEEQTKDKWNYWVYRLGTDGTYNTDQTYKTSTVSTSASANRTTNKLRINFSISNYVNNSSYKYEDNGSTTIYKFINKSYQVSHYLVASMNRHLSVGYELSYSNSTFSNNKSRKYISGGIEYAIFPYSQVNTKFFTLSYSVDMRENKYYDTTIYDKISERLLGHKLQANFSLKQKWGNINSGISYSNYLNDWGLNNLSVSLSINLRITGGLFFYIYSYGGLIHDQVYLVKGNATLQEILTRRRQLESSYSFYSGAGLSFRFGSILNNFVNPRMSFYQ